MFLITKAEATEQVLEKIISVNDEQWADPWVVSQKLRRNFRQEKKQRIDHQAKDSDFVDKNGLSLRLLPLGEGDEVRARSVSFKEKDIHDSLKTRVLSRSMFTSSSNDRPSELDDVINRHKIKIDPFLSQSQESSFAKGEEGKLVTKDESIKKSLELLVHYSSEGSD